MPGVRPGRPRVVRDVPRARAPLRHERRGQLERHEDVLPRRELCLERRRTGRAPQVLDLRELAHGARGGRPHMRASSTGRPHPSRGRRAKSLHGTQVTASLARKGHRLSGPSGWPTFDDSDVETSGEW